MALITITEKKTWADSKYRADEHPTAERLTKSRTVRVRLFGIKVLSITTDYEFSPKPQGDSPKR